MTGLPAVFLNRTDYNMKIQFLGGVQEVTGSTHVLSTATSRILRDAGLFQGRRTESREKNKTVFDNIGKLDAVVLSHAHIDHCGNLPSLIKHGYDGPVYAQQATADLCTHMLRDSAHIQEIDAEYVNRKLKKNNEPPIEPLYSDEDVEQTMKLFKGHTYHEKIELTPDISFTAYDAGHILGASLHEFEIRENGRELKVGYAFDLGRRNLPIIRDPEQLSDIDALVIESTYGNRYHRNILQTEDILAGVITRTYRRGGKVIIPSFALSRSQEVIRTLLEMYHEDRIPRLPIYLDSPLACHVTDVYLEHRELYDQETIELIQEMKGKLYEQYVHTTRSTADSKALNDDDRPMIIISASGMCESGRILHHLKNNVEDPKNTVIIVGYQAQHTLGRRIVEREPEIRIFGTMYKMNAERVVLNTYSGHADRNDLLQFISHAGERCKTFIFVHGEPKAISDLAAAVGERRPGCRIETPSRGDVIEF
jgi:metallo-beta-lactamase family protein